MWLEGEHDIATQSELAATLAKAMSGDDCDLVVDLGAVTFLSAATVNELVRGRVFLKDHARSLTLRAPSSRAQRVLDLCELTGFVERPQPDALTA